jgi:HK97 family phage major capsid protein
MTTRNANAIDDILESIKEIGEARVSKIEFESKMASLKNAVENRNKELDNQMGSLETNLEKKMAQIVDNINSAFENQRYAKTSKTTRFKGFGDFLQKVKNKSFEIKDLSEVVGNEGGYLVPDEFLNEILKVQLEQSVVRSSGARIIPMTSAILKIPAVGLSSNAFGSTYGGATAFWGKENTNFNETQPTFDLITLEPKKLTAYCEDPNELEQDAIVSMSSLLTELFSEVLNFEEDVSFISGDGINKPLGVLNAPCLVTISRTTASQVVTNDIITMLSRFRGSLDRAVFLVNQTVLPSIYKLKDENNNYIWHPGMNSSIAGAALGTIYGIPFKVTEKCPAVGTTGDIILGDFGHYLIGERDGLRVDYSEHYKFQADQTAYRLVKRVDGQPWLRSAITPRTGNVTLSPFVALT